MTNFDKDLFTDWGKAVVSVTVAFGMLMLACLMCGCTKTQYVPMQAYHTEAVKTDSTMFLSLLQTLRQIERTKQSNSDTIIINHYERAKVNEQGDTIDYESNTDTYKSTSRERELERVNETLRDSLRIMKARQSVVKVDSVPVPYLVERKLSRWEQAKMDLGGVAILAFVISLVAIGIMACIVKKYRK